MRLWHQDLIPKLPRQQLLGQHRECCALRGKGWLKPHSTINYIFKYSREKLYLYHTVVMDEMKNRGYSPNTIWYNPQYCGTKIGYNYNIKLTNNKLYNKKIYHEHNDDYLKECLSNLKNKNIIIN